MFTPGCTENAKYFWHSPDMLSGEQADLCRTSLSLAGYFYFASHYRLNTCKTFYLVMKEPFTYTECGKL